MQLYQLKPAADQLIFTLAVYLLSLAAVILLNIELTAKLLFLTLLVLLLLYEIKRIRLQAKTSVIAIRHQSGKWRIKAQDVWIEAKLVKTIYISDLILVLHFAHKSKKYYAGASLHSLAIEDFRHLRIAARLSQ